MVLFVKIVPVKQNTDRFHTDEIRATEISSRLNRLRVEQDRLGRQRRKKYCYSPRRHGEHRVFYFKLADPGESSTTEISP
jgi:hypothetical protein